MNAAPPVCATQSPTIEDVRLVIASWKTDARMSESADLKEKMQVSFRNQSVALTEIFCELLQDVLGVAEHQSAEAQRLHTYGAFYEAIFEEIEKTLLEAHGYFEEVVSTCDNSTVLHVRACELWNSFTYAINIIAQFIGIPEGDFAPALTKDGAVHHIVLSRELAGVVTYSNRIELEDPNKFLRSYTPLRADVRDRNIAQVLRMDPKTYADHVDWILRHLKRSLRSNRAAD